MFGGRNKSRTGAKLQGSGFLQRNYDKRHHDTIIDAGSDASPTFEPSRDLPVALGLGNDLPSACGRFCVGLAIGLTIGGGEIKAYWIGIPLACTAFRRRRRGIANLAEAFALWSLSPPREQC